jgi:lipoprotein NlpI
VLVSSPCRRTRRARRAFRNLIRVTTGPKYVTKATQVSGSVERVTRLFRAIMNFSCFSHVDYSSHFFESGDIKRTNEKHVILEILKAVNMKNTVL